MGNVLDLKNLLVTAAASITDSIDKAECLTAIDDWYAARVSLAALSAGTITSYQINGRNVTKRDIPTAQAYVAQLYAEIKARLYNQSSGLVDMRGTDT
jgi:hypothetical protein